MVQEIEFKKYIDEKNSEHTTFNVIIICTTHIHEDSRYVASVRSTHLRTLIARRNNSRALMVFAVFESLSVTTVIH